MGPRNRESMGWEKLEKPRQSVRTQAIEHVGRTAVTGGGYITGGRQQQPAAESIETTWQDRTPTQQPDSTREQEQ